MEKLSQKANPGKLFLTIFLFVALFGIAFALSLVLTNKKDAANEDKEIVPTAEIILPQSTPTPEISATPTIGIINKAGEGCKISGCNGEICLNTSDELAVSTCIYKEYFACYKSAKCEKQSSGNCDWTETKTLKECITQKQDAFCGGIAGKTCPDGFTCQLDGNYPDAGGKCVKVEN